MRFAAPVGVLKDALQLAFSAVPSRPTIPALGSVLCVADGGGLSLTGGSPERSLTVPCEATVAEPGSCLLPAKFLAALREYDETVAVEVGEREIAVHLVKGSTHDKFTYAVEDHNSYPAPDDPPDSPTLTLPAATLRQALDRTVFAASRDEGKYAMRGVLWDGGSLIATDGKRLAVADLGVKSPTPALLPPDAMGFVGRLCEGGDVRVSLLENAACFVTDAGTVYTRLVEGRFPPYREVIPKSGTTTVTLDAGSFLADVRRAALATDDESKRVEFNFEGGKVVMQARSATAGSSAVVHQAADHSGPDVVISFDPHYLTDARHALTGEVVLSLNGPEKAGVFRRDGVLYLAVPLC